MNVWVFGSLANRDPCLRSWILISSSWQNQRSEILPSRKLSTRLKSQRSEIVRRRTLGKLSMRLKSKATKIEVQISGILYSLCK